MNSLRLRLFGAFCLIILVVLGVIGPALLVLLRNSSFIERPTLITLSQAARTLQRQLPLAEGASDAELERYVARAAAFTDLRALIVNAGGEVIADSEPNGPALNVQLRAARLNAAFGLSFGRARDAAGTTWTYTVRRASADRFFLLAAPQSRFPLIRIFIEDLLGPLLQAGAIAALCALVLSGLIASSVAGPLQQMAGVARGIARGDYSQSAPVTGPDEVRTLGQAFNVMAQQVQAGQQAQRDFLANVSHELKTPLTSIQGFAQAIKDGMAGSPESVRHSAGIIYAEAERMRRLVSDLLELARLDAGLRMLKRAPVEVRLLLSSLVEKFALRAQERGLMLEARLPAQLPLLEGDADRLAQVFTNLLDNALQHTPGGGRVTLSADMKANELEVVVADTGPGIPAEDIPRVFERFYQVDKSRARPAGGGLGLGLAISREIVEAHHGRIWAESTPGQGARFIVRLPLAPADESTTIRRRKQAS
jgi:signal transduction histidine kinase